VTIVIDASIVLSWYFDDEKSAATDDVLELVNDSSAIVPGHWRLEISNSFRSAARRGRVSLEYRDAVLNELSTLPIEVDEETATHAWGATLKLADKHGLTPYDAAYLELAQRRRVSLATLDSRLKRAAAEESIDVVPLSQ
jgi:predicted nucleic acid-binding protein